MVGQRRLVPPMTVGMSLQLLFLYALFICIPSVFNIYIVTSLQAKRHLTSAAGDEEVDLT